MIACGWEIIYLEDVLIILKPVWHREYLMMLSLMEIIGFFQLPIQEMLVILVSELYMKQKVHFILTI